MIRVAAKIDNVMEGKVSFDACIDGHVKEKNKSRVSQSAPAEMIAMSAGAGDSDRVRTHIVR